MHPTRKHEPAPPGYRYVFRRWKTDEKTGRRVYPKKAKVFRMLVPISDARK
ncbi:hypothetical protein [Corallococcus sp. CA054B]|uniref:hypothetical protein n=1 Tax=Corallococcus sp. CA054B TaxID=2316734 RepID=UPI0018F65C97|nr:hypothetical protein [Corallococcus sp. CA054B]